MQGATRTLCGAVAFSYCSGARLYSYCKNTLKMSSRFVKGGCNGLNPSVVARARIA